MSRPGERAEPRRRPPAEVRAALQRAVAARALAALACALAALGIASAAFAGWSATGSGTGTAGAGTLAPPTGVATSSAGADVTVTWTGALPPEGALTGYTVSRWVGATRHDACGTDPAQSVTFVPDGTLTCTDVGVPDGDHIYTVTSVFRTWTAQSEPSAPVTVEAPQQSLTLVPGATNASLTGAALYYRSAVAGGFALRSTVTSVQAGPASATFPDVAAAGWTHAAETVTTGSGGPSSIEYTSSAYSWDPSPGLPATHVVTAHDNNGGRVETALTFTPDDDGPTGGALTVNGTAAAAVPTIGYATTDYPIDVRTDYTDDAGSGIATSVLTVLSASLAGNVCGAFGAPVEVTGAPTQVGTSPTCYLYVLTGTDAVGNTSSISTVVKYDADPPTQSVTLVDPVNAAQTGNTLYFRTAAGSFTLSSELTDAETAPASVDFPEITTAGWTHDAESVTDGTGVAPTTSYASATYTFTASASTPPGHDVLGRDLAGNLATTSLTITRDSTAPTGGALTVNGGVATTGGSTSFSATGDFTIGARTDYTDAASGIDTSTLTLATASLSGGVCGTYGTPTVLVGAPDQLDLTTGCYLYTLTGLDRVGNIAFRSHTVKVDLETTTGGALRVNSVDADDSPSGTMSYSRANPVLIDQRDDWDDAESGLASSTLYRTYGTLTNGTCAAFANSTTVTGTASQTLTTTRCYRYVLTGTDNAGNSSAVTTVVHFDTVVPVTGALTVNGVASSTAGTTSFNKTGYFSIGSRVEYTDAGSGIASSVLTLATAPLNANTCGTYGSTTVLAGTPAQSGLTTGCYRYTLTGTDLAGNVQTTTHTVKVDDDPAMGGAMTVNGTAADDSPGGTLSYSRTNPVLINARTDWTDAESGLATSTLTSAFGTLSNGTCAASGSTSTITGTTSQTLTTTRCYRYVLTGTDNAGNASAVTTVVRYDTVVPVTGALTVNGVAASGAGTTSFNKTGSFTIGTRTDWTDAGSGIASSVLTAATAPLSANTCGTYGATTELIGTPAQSGLTTGCHRYTLTGTDLAGNVATTTHTVKVDLEPATSGAVTINGTAASPAGTTSGPTNAASIPIDSRTDYTDAASGIATSTLTRAVGSFAGGACGTFSGSTTITGTTAQTGLATNCYRYTLTGTDNATNTAAISTVVRVDYTLPVTGALTVNSVAARSAGTSSFNKTGSFTIGTRTDYTDAASGIGSSVLTVASATLTANTCGTYGSPTVLAGNPAQSGLGTGCYRFVLTGTDLAGNVASTTHTVKVDRDVPTGGAVTVNGTAADTVSTTSGPTNAAPFTVDSRTDYVDAESGLSSSLLIRALGTYTAGACGTFSGSTTITGTTTQSGLATNCYRYTLTGTDNATNTAAVSTIVRVDVTPPTAGALTVNGTAANAGGTVSTANSGSFTIGTRTANTDAASGLASSTLTRESAALTGSTCAAFASPVVIVGAPGQTGLATGCYRYTLTGVDNVGNSTAISTTVKLGVYTSAVALVNGTGTAGRADQGDRAVVTFSDDIDVASICSAWTGNGSDQSITGNNQVTVTLTDGGAGNDSLSVTSSACTLNAGTVALASTAYTTSTVTFGGTGSARSTVAWSASTRTLTITFGQVSGAGPATVTGNVIATYTPSNGVTNPAAVPLGGIFATAAVRQF